MKIVVLLKQGQGNGKTLEDNSFCPQHKHPVEDLTNSFASTIRLAAEMKEKYGGDLTVITTKPPENEVVESLKNSLGIDLTISLDNWEVSDSEGQQKPLPFSKVIANHPFDIILTNKLSPNHEEDHFDSLISRKLKVLHLKSVANLNNFDFFDRKSRQILGHKELQKQESHTQREKQHHVLVKLPCLISVEDKKELWSQTELA